MYPVCEFSKPLLLPFWPLHCSLAPRLRIGRGEEKGEETQTSQFFSLLAVLVDLVGEELLLAKMRHWDYLWFSILDALPAPNYHTQSSQPNFPVSAQSTSEHGVMFRSKTLCVGNQPMILLILNLLKMPRSGTILITGEKTQESDHISMDPILTGDFSQHSNFL